MIPDPLLRMMSDNPFKRVIVHLRIDPNVVLEVRGDDLLNRTLQSKDVLPSFAVDSNWHDRRARTTCDHGQTAEGPGRPPEEVDLDRFFG